MVLIEKTGASNGSEIIWYTDPEEVWLQGQEALARLFSSPTTKAELLGLSENREESNSMRDCVGKVGRVTWRDPMSNDSWQPEEKAIYQQPSTCITWGKVLRDDEECVVIASSVTVVGDTALVGSVMSIPSELVDEIKVVKG